MTFEVEEDSEFVFVTNTEEVLWVDGVARESVQSVDACTEVSHAPACELMVGEQHGAPYERLPGESDCG